MDKALLWKVLTTVGGARSKNRGLNIFSSLSVFTFSSFLCDPLELRWTAVRALSTYAGLEFSRRVLVG